MVWIRYARIRAVWRCFTIRGYFTKYHAVGAAIRDEYEKKPIEDIDEWAKRLGKFVAEKMCENSCQSLSASVFCDITSVDVDIIYTSQTLVVPPEVVKPKVVKPKEEVEKLKERKKIVPKYIRDQIEYLEERYKEAETADEKMAIREEIDKIKRRYGIPIEKRK